MEQTERGLQVPFLPPFYIRGLFLSDAPLGPNDGLLDASQVFVIEIPERMIEHYELIEEGQGKGYREWCVPAEVVNKYFSKRVPLGLHDLIYGHQFLGDKKATN